MGAVEIPADALYQAQTQRALDNFKISSLRLPASMIRAMALIKQTASEVNVELGKLDAGRGAAIASAAASIAAGEHAEQFPVDVFQTGPGNIERATLPLARDICRTIARLDGAQAHIDAVGRDDEMIVHRRFAAPPLGR